MPQETRVDRLVRRVKDTPVLAKLILAGIVLVVIGEFTESIDKIWSFVEKRAMPSREANTLLIKDRPPGSVTLPVDLDVLIFNAAKDPQAHALFARAFLQNYPGVLVSSRSDWAQRYEMESSLILFQGQWNQRYADELAEWFPGSQEVLDYQNNLRGFFGVDPERDIIIFLGNDWRGMREILRGERPTQAVERTDTATFRDPAAHRQ